MAKLYCEIESERTGKHQVGNDFLEMKIYYGTKENPKLLTHIFVRAETKEQPVQWFQFSTVEPKPMILQKEVIAE
jgi:hypothetical protein